MAAHFDSLSVGPGAATAAAAGGTGGCAGSVRGNFCFGTGGIYFAFSR